MPRCVQMPSIFNTLQARLLEQSSGQATRFGVTEEDGLKRLNIVLKADVSGSLEARVP